ncbi:2-oxo-4-hydroxy-4-carboxy-5-ureidoimidazoline decarboxylase [Candidatus Gracilibacteria bacterium]|nr:2-oxo-4-hydroxy-4-carboxy-5-ureidoimidazoline decarboxylase [Candidatus Gracilibacteria bacterium]
MKLATLNQLAREDFVAAIGFVFEGSPWIADATWEQRPFASLESLHTALCMQLDAAPLEHKLALINAHPDLVGRAARAGTLDAASSAEQVAAGLNTLNAAEIALFDRYNAAYRERFGFPFVICARDNKKDTILAAFPQRLQHSRAAEIATALHEIRRIAWLRLGDVADDGIAMEMCMMLNETQCVYLDEVHYGVVGTLNTDGSIQQTLIWYLRETSDTIAFGLAVHSIKARNLRRNPHCTLTVSSGARYLTVAGSAVVLPAEPELRRRTALRYLGPERVEEWLARPATFERATVRITINKVYGQGVA